MVRRDHPRLLQHRTQSHWYYEITNVTVETFPTDAEAKAAEKKAIATENPLHNIVGKHRGMIMTYEETRTQDALCTGEPAASPRPRLRVTPICERRAHRAAVLLMCLGRC